MEPCFTTMSIPSELFGPVSNYLGTDPRDSISFITWSTLHKSTYMDDPLTLQMIYHGRRPFAKILILPGADCLVSGSCFLMCNSSMVPALAIGFDDLQKRVDAQGKTAQAHNAKLEVLGLSILPKHPS